MNVLTLKIPESLDVALRAASRDRGLSKSAVVREAIEQALGVQGQRSEVAAHWVAQWRGRLAAPPSDARRRTIANAATDPRLAHLLAKHVR